MGRDNTKGKIQRTILHHLSWRGMAASLAMAALPAAAAEPDSLAIDTMSYDLGDVTVTAQRKLVKNDIRADALNILFVNICVILL